MRILAATNNKHKIGEFRSILANAGFELVSPDSLGREVPDIPEDGATFEENAAIKALGFAKFAGMTVIADDSGLEIKALGNAPGIYSARYADTNDKRIERVLRELEEVKRKTGETENRRCGRGENIEHRTQIGNQKSKIENTGGWRDETGGSPDRSARFVCVIALAVPGKVVATFRGEVYGRIGFEARGAGGFGYDPVFIPDGYDKTFAELGSEIKDSISHRANALGKMNEYLNLNRENIEHAAMHG